MSTRLCGAWNGVHLTEFLRIIHEACKQRPPKHTDNKKSAVVAQVSNPSTWKVEAEESEGQGQSEASLSQMRPYTPQKEMGEKRKGSVGVISPRPEC